MHPVPGPQKYKCIAAQDCLRRLAPERLAVLSRFPVEMDSPSTAVAGLLLAGVAVHFLIAAYVLFLCSRELSSEDVLPSLPP